jgi:hypothetical protein
MIDAKKLYESRYSFNPIPRLHDDGSVFYNAREKRYFGFKLDTPTELIIYLFNLDPFLFLEKLEAD